MILLKQLWRDERGFVASTELILISVILVLGMIVGLVTLRDQVVQEFGDLGGAVGQLNQSYSIDPFVTGTFSVAGSQYQDKSDDGELGTNEGDNNNDAANVAPGVMSFGPGTGE